MSDDYSNNYETNKILWTYTKNKWQQRLYKSFNKVSDYNN